MVIGIHNYYRIATHCTMDFSKLQFEINKAMKNRLDLKRKGKTNNQLIRDRYGDSVQLRYLGDYPIASIGYCKSRNPMSKKKSINQYTPKGREELYEKPQSVDMNIVYYLMEHPIKNKSIEYNDNRLSLFIGQKGKCYITGSDLVIGHMHCHHEKPLYLGGTDKYQNLKFVTDEVHRLIHAKDKNTISEYLEMLKLSEPQLAKLNNLRVSAGLEIIK